MTGTDEDCRDCQLSCLSILRKHLRTPVVVFEKQWPRRGVDIGHHCLRLNDLVILVVGRLDERHLVCEVSLITACMNEALYPHSSIRRDVVAGVSQLMINLSGFTHIFSCGP